MSDGPKKRKLSARVLFVLGVFAASLGFFVVNWFYHVARKPSEIVGLMDKRFYKNPKQTWITYGADFQAYATPIITPEFLAALAQTETGGNSIARTYWQWNLAAKNPFQIYAPASSAVGLFQLTDGTFSVAKKYCVRGGFVLEEGPWYDLRSCWFNGFYNRLIPSHSIEMTSAYLHVSVVETLKKYKVHSATHQQKQDLAAVIHLCGLKKGDTFARKKFKFSSKEMCGSFRPRSYLSKVQKYQRVFARLRTAQKSTVYATLLTAD